ncbi:hypothetical protein [Membranihabitans maritimus]|uniref:hypothetical protein n=1 Tax=Membranihabitans maritimus TaxID=2904244 RepID=UPI001F2F9CFC|nr:hypothetical protein [Membranihabitans maritimus]
MIDNVNKTNKKDIAHSLAKGGLGAIPVIGSLASEIFGLVLTPPLERRRAEWMDEIAEKLKELESKREIDLDELKENELFIDIVLQATTFALKTAERKKIECFKNAVLNTAIGESPDKTKSQIFLNQLDKFTTWHIIILDFIDSPKNWFEENAKTPPNYMTGNIYSLIIEAFPELKDQDELLGIIWDDLKMTGFHKTGGLKTMMTGNGVLSDRTTAFGKEFLNFVLNKKV